MTPQCWVWFAGLQWIFLVCVLQNRVLGGGHTEEVDKTKNYFKELTDVVIVAENFTCIFKLLSKHCAPCGRAEFKFLPVNVARRVLPEVRKRDSSYFLILQKWLKNMKVNVYVAHGNCSTGIQLQTGDAGQPTCDFNHSSSVVPDNATGAQTSHEISPCQVRCFHLNTICSTHYKQPCDHLGIKSKGQYVINVTAQTANCAKCVSDKPTKPEEQITLPRRNGTDMDAETTVLVMNDMKDLASSLDTSSAAVSVGDDIMGVITTQTEPDDAEEVSFAYTHPNESFNIVTELSQDLFKRSITVSKEAFEKAFRNSSFAYVAVLRFTNFAQDELNSTILGNEVLAIEMGTNISDLVDKIKISFKNVECDGIPSCRSWNSEGARPRWSDDGCETTISGDRVTCQCSHLTFFAILMSPLNETISSSDLNNLTIITQVGCGLSMFFLCIALFMHYLIRRTKATNTTKILIHLLWAMLLLNLTFLINSSVADLNHTVGCKIMAAAMHYFLLATFTWFAAQAFHLCLQMYNGGRILIKRYVLKVSVASWGIPCVIVTVLLSVDRYGQQLIRTDDGANDATMCWITDGDVQYIVNIGYYALTFLFTFSTLVIILTWFVCLTRANRGTPQANTSGISVSSVMGLCCLLGVTWGFAFFAHGVLRIPAYYIFTVLNSFHGFFLFIYYYANSDEKTTSSSPSAGVSSSSSSSINTTATTLGNGLTFLENPYNLPAKKPQASEDG